MTVVSLANDVIASCNRAVAAAAPLDPSESAQPKRSGPPGLTRRTGQSRTMCRLAVSLDGFVARSDGVIDWLSTRRPGGVDHGDHRHHANLEMLGQIGLVVLGRRAYEEMAPAWSSSDSPMARISAKAAR